MTRRVSSSRKDERIEKRVLSRLPQTIAFLRSQIIYGDPVETLGPIPEIIRISIKFILIILGHLL
jgi:hypothetical protein